jgi:NADH:ubiquinone reductase (H+-translocating)
MLAGVISSDVQTHNVAQPLRRALIRLGASFRRAELDGVDPKRQIVTAGGREFPYEHLVLALGAEPAYFGIPGVEEHCISIRGIDAGERICNRVIERYEETSLEGGEVPDSKLTFVIIGGGATGVEMAGAIAEIARQTLANDFRRIDPRTSHIILLEAGPRLMPALPDDLSDYAARTLTRMGVEVRTSSRVTNCDERGVELEHGRIDAGTVIWAAGVVASPAARWLNAEHDRAGRVLVGPDLSVPGKPEIFVIGDAAAARTEKGDPVPGMAPGAKQMGRYVGRLIAARIAGRTLPPFRYHHLGDLATIGRHAAVVKFGKLRLKGFIGWLFWSVVHIYFLIGVKNRFTVAFTWLWDYVTFQRGARLITEVPPPGKR